MTENQRNLQEALKQQHHCTHPPTAAAGVRPYAKGQFQQLNNNFNREEIQNIE